MMGERIVNHVSAISDSTTSGSISAAMLTLAAPNGLFTTLLLGHGTVILLMLMFDYDLSRLQSLLSVSFAAFCGLMVIFVLYLRNTFGSTAILILSSAFVLKVLVGVLNSLYFFDADYFTNSLGFDYFFDYAWMENYMLIAAGYWRDNGFSLLPNTITDNNKNVYLLTYNALLYYLGGENYLNIAPWNALHSMYVAIIVGALALKAGATRVQARFALALAAFQPFGFISNIMWRDSVGQFWLILGLYLIIISNEKKYLWVITFPVACFFAWSQRQPYLFAILVVSAYLLLSSIFQEKLKIRTKIAIGVLLITCLWFLPDLISLAFSLHKSYGDTYFDFVPLLFPLRVIRALAGPFPWFQIFMGVNGVEFMLPNFFQAVYNLTLLILVAPLAVRMWKESRRIEPCMLFALLIYLMAVQAVGVHIDYTAIGIVLLIPLACQLPRAKWLRTFVVCFYGFLFANIFYWMTGLAGSGIIMGITGH